LHKPSPKSKIKKCETNFENIYYFVFDLQEKEIELCGRANRPIHPWSGLLLMAFLTWLLATG
jgi:hypothetical protein